MPEENAWKVVDVRVALQHDQSFIITTGISRSVFPFDSWLLENDLRYPGREFLRYGWHADHEN